MFIFFFFWLFKETNLLGVKCHTWSYISIQKLAHRRKHEHTYTHTAQIRPSSSGVRISALRDHMAAFPLHRVMANRWNSLGVASWWAARAPPPPNLGVNYPMEAGCGLTVPTPQSLHHQWDKCDTCLSAVAPWARSLRQLT